ncbi:hypothetical protein BL253_21665 [Pseudofrankia asymbiotica]|uniref:Uncharacterized protein n=1 Tax=Pseudofrankia asymbiotica TaxID=1834516 RepID=A0A1V2I6X2_9ACTN|nr:hypothetical protein BL253_21665 [Pseudofrankia asymbiotica]
MSSQYALATSHQVRVRGTDSPAPTSVSTDRPDLSSPRPLIVFGPDSAAVQATTAMFADLDNRTAAATPATV